MAPARATATISAMALVGVIGWPQETNVGLAAAWRDRGIPAELVNPAVAISLLYYVFGNVVTGLIGGVIYLWRSVRSVARVDVGIKRKT